MGNNISQKKRQANRNNAQRSTGPRSIAGKNKSRYNALTHGLTAKALLLPGEDSKEFHEYFRRVRKDLRPKGFLEEIRVEDAVVASWRLSRAVRYENAWVERELKHAKTKIDQNGVVLPERETFELVARYDTKHRNDRDRALRELERIQDRRRREARERDQVDRPDSIPSGQPDVAQAEPGRDEA